jgi:acetyl esterase
VILGNGGSKAVLDLAAELRRNAGAIAADSFFRGMAAAGRLHPLSRPERHNVEVLRDVAYDSDLSHHRLDIYRPTASAGPLPIVIYVHGGGFRILSKDTHWVMSLLFARRGFLVFNINYRLAPAHPFPAAVADACAAYRWVVANAAAYGGDTSRLLLAGESAGANLVTALAVAASYERPEPFARTVFDTNVVPRAVMSACGILQVSDPARFSRRRKLHVFVRDRLSEVTEAYLGSADASGPGGLALADPLCILEGDARPVRPLPAFFAPVGTRDPLLDDTRRLRAALERLGTPCEARFYPGEMHAFHALVFREPARRCWTDAFAFIDQHLVAGL